MRNHILDLLAGLDDSLFLLGVVIVFLAMSLLYSSFATFKYGSFFEKS